MVKRSSHDLLGRVFERLLVIDVGGEGDSRRWICRCLCGSDRLLFVRTAQLTTGHTRSCGCIRKETNRAGKTKHGHNRKGDRSPEYTSWAHMLSRCTNPNHHKYPIYGARGIKVDPRWENFEAFLADMGPRPGPGYSLNRIDNDGNYEPGNVEWATAKAQSRNQRSNRVIEFNGRSMCVSEWAEHLGMKPKTLEMRFLRGWSVERALTAETQSNG